MPGVPFGKKGDWMPIPAQTGNCPRGLESLMVVDQLLVKQQVEIFEAVTSFETQNKYIVKNRFNENVYYIAENTSCCQRYLGGPLRSFDMEIFDSSSNEVLHLYRPFKCFSLLPLPCCLHTIEVSAPPGTVIGSIEQVWKFCIPRYKVKNQRGQTVLRIKGPLCRFRHVHFKVLSLDGREVGSIDKQWSGVGREVLTDADFFGITFPMDLDVRIKAVLLGATILIDMMYFED